jgi:hypothetical protein
MAKFKCIYTGQVYTFEVSHDIDTMRKHPEYTEVKEEEKKEEVKPTLKLKKEY